MLAVQNRRVFPYLVGVIAATSALTGAVAHVIDRKDFPTFGVGVWGAVVTLGWALGWMTSWAAGVDLGPWAVFGSIGAWAFQLVTGLTLAWILRRTQGNVPATRGGGLAATEGVRV